MFQTSPRKLCGGVALTSKAESCHARARSFHRLVHAGQASVEQQLELLQAGRSAGWIDTTEASIERAKARLAELNELLTETGKASVALRGT